MTGLPWKLVPPPKGAQTPLEAICGVASNETAVSTDACACCSMRMVYGMAPEGLYLLPSGGPLKGELIDIILLETPESAAAFLERVIDTAPPHWLNDRVRRLVKSWVRERGEVEGSR